MVYKPSACAVFCYCCECISNCGNLDSLVNVFWGFFTEFCAILWKGDITDNGSYSTI